MTLASGGGGEERVASPNGALGELAWVAPAAHATPPLTVFWMSSSSPRCGSKSGRTIAAQTSLSPLPGSTIPVSLMYPLRPAGGVGAGGGVTGPSGNPLRVSIPPSPTNHLGWADVRSLVRYTPLRIACWLGGVPATPDQTKYCCWDSPSAA